MCAYNNSPNIVQTNLIGGKIRLAKSTLKIQNIEIKVEPGGLRNARNGPKHSEMVKS